MIFDTAVTSPLCPPVPDADTPMLAAIASSPAHYYAAVGRAEVVTVFGSIARRAACADATWGGR